MPEADTAMRRTLLLLLSLALLPGCALPVALEGGITVAQYASSAYNGYTLTNEYYPRDRLDAEASADMRLEEAVRERLHGEPSTHYAQVVPLCYAGEVYLLGRVSSEDERAALTRTAASTPGVKGVTRCLLGPGAPPVPPERSRLAANAVNRRLAALAGVRPERLRVEAVGTHVVVLAYVASPAERSRIQTALASVPEAASVTTYLPLAATGGSQLAAR